MKYQRILKPSRFEIFSCLLLMQLDYIVNIPGYLLYLFSKLLNCCLEVILFNLSARPYLFLYQLINPSFYLSSNRLHWMNQFISDFLFE